MTAKVAAHNAEETKEPTPSLRTITRMKSRAARQEELDTASCAANERTHRGVPRSHERTKVLKAKERAAKSKAAIDHAGGLRGRGRPLFPQTALACFIAARFAAYAAIVFVAMLINNLCERPRV